jgi:hypothetical protein
MYDTRKASSARYMFFFSKCGKYGHLQHCCIAFGHWHNLGAVNTTCVNQSMKLCASGYTEVVKIRTILLVVACVGCHTTNNEGFGRQFDVCHTADTKLPLR